MLKKQKQNIIIKEIEHQNLIYYQLIFKNLEMLICLSTCIVFKCEYLDKFLQWFHTH